MMESWDVIETIILELTENLKFRSGVLVYFSAGGD